MRVRRWRRDLPLARAAAFSRANASGRCGSAFPDTERGAEVPASARRRPSGFGEVSPLNSPSRYGGPRPCSRASRYGGQAASRATAHLGDEGVFGHAGFWHNAGRPGYGAGARGTIRSHKLRCAPAGGSCSRPPLRRYAGVGTL